MFQPIGTHVAVSKSCMILPCASSVAETPMTRAVAQISGSLAPKFMMSLGISLDWLGFVSGVHAEPGSALLTVTLRMPLQLAAAAETRAASSRVKYRRRPLERPYWCACFMLSLL